MKKFVLFTCVVALLATACGGNKGDVNTGMVQNPEAGDSEFAEIKFDTTTYNFGTIKEGESIAYEFVFTNTGTTDLLISNAAASCGCTVPDWPRHPIKPGEKDKIKVVFNSTGKSGSQHKTVNLTTNCKESTQTINIMGEVIPKDK